MSTSGSAIRSAKMKLMTPPKLMPPFHSAAAIGTLPIEHTKLITAMNGPTTTFSTLVQKPWPFRNTSFQTSRYEHGEKARDEVADDELFAQHVDVGEGVARRVCPRGFRTQLPAPRRAFELRLAFLADADHR